MLDSITPQTTTQGDLFMAASFAVGSRSIGLQGRAGIPRVEDAAR
jgi:hypothetical protein